MTSPEVRKFLATHVDSAETLDILMLLHREPQVSWTAKAVSDRVFSVPQAVQPKLDDLVRRGLAEERADEPGAYRLVLADATQAAALQAVRAAYDASRANVINVVFSQKTSPVQSFSNAFKLRGDS